MCAWQTFLLQEIFVFVKSGAHIKFLNKIKYLNELLKESFSVYFRRERKRARTNKWVRDRERKGEKEPRAGPMLPVQSPTLGSMKS